MGVFREGAARGLPRLVLVLTTALAVLTGAVGTRAAPAEAPPPRVAELLRLLDDPSVRAWLERRRADAPPPSPAPAPGGAGTGTMASPDGMATRLSGLRAHLAALAAAGADLPRAFRDAGRVLGGELTERGLLSVLLLVAGFAALGFGAERLFRRAASGVRRWLIGLPLATTRERVVAVSARFAYGVAWVTSFGLGSVGAFLAFDWPPLAKRIVLGGLLVMLAVWLALVFGRFLLSPGAPRFRVLPMSTDAAWFWVRRTGFAVGWFALGWVTVDLLAALGFPPDARRLIGYGLGLGLLVLGLEIAWRRPEGYEGAGGTGTARQARAWLLSAYFVGLWLLWVANAMPVFWLAVAAVGAPLAVGAARRAVEHVLRPPGTEASGGPPDVRAVLAERALRAAILIATALLLARAWEIDLTGLAGGETGWVRLARGALHAAVILLLADLGWRVAKTVIDGRLAEDGDDGGDAEAARRRARLRTLLPILRNILAVVLAVMAALMTLSALGVEIGPLVAGAGVVGVAVGFGAQTVVKDVISGVFFLLDDAFRVGEYIQSGSYKGTVESFSLRSLKLRHHRGPLTTVPFGDLGAVENMSRDWVIDKLTIGVAYDTDLEKARKLIKKIGQEIAADPEFAGQIIEPLKMQGVEQFGDFAIQIRLKMMTRPGEQFVPRRRAYARIKQAFDDAGIKFAFPTVQVGGGAAGEEAAAAQKGLEMTRPAPVPEA